jgi:hypothetical protein
MRLHRDHDNPLDPDTVRVPSGPTMGAILEATVAE